MSKILLLLWILILDQRAWGLQASKVYFEYIPSLGVYRVRTLYTIPELKEKREMRAEFRAKKEAEEFYWKLVKGGDFSQGDPKSVKFLTQPAKADPW